MTDEAKLIHSVGLTPNQVSAIGIAFAVLSALAYWKWRSHFFISISAPLSLIPSSTDTQTPSSFVESSSANFVTFLGDLPH